MIDIMLHKLSKKANSTLRPTSGVRVQGYFRNSVASVTEPVVVFNLSQETAPDYNYAVIPALNRYFFIMKWVFAEGHWVASMAVDVLATYRDEIGAADLYVLRSSAESDPAIVDSLYPTTTNVLTNQRFISPVRCYTNNLSDPTDTTYQPSQLWASDFSLGCYILGIYGPNPSGVEYYVLTPQCFLDLVTRLMDFQITGSGLWQTATVEIPEAYAKALADPLQYIVSCRWCPVNPLNMQHMVVNLNLGYYKLTGSLNGIRSVAPAADMLHFSATMDLLHHPQISRGTFLNASPYSTYHLTIQPWGEVDLDGSLLAGEEQLKLDWTVDWISGDALLKLTTAPSGRYLGETKTNFFVSIPISQVTIDAQALVKGGLSVMQSAATVLGHVFRAALDHPIMLGLGAAGLTGGMLFDFASHLGDDPSASDLGNYISSQLQSGTLPSLANQAISGLSSWLPSTQPHVKSNGTPGSFLAYGSQLIPALHQNFWIIADEDNQHLGRPLCKVRKPSDLRGYLQCESPSITLWGTAEEAKQVNNFVQGGFFYE